MSTSPSPLDAALANVPSAFRGRIVKRYGDLKSAFVDQRFDSCGVLAGRLSEVLLRYLQHQLTGTSTQFGTRISNFSDECRKLERLPVVSGPESLRVLIPRALEFAYTMRNKRAFGHEGEEVDAYEIDALTSVRIMDWCISELIRATLAVPMEEAQAVVNAIAVRQIPVVWVAPGGHKRILTDKFNYAEQVLLLLYNDIQTALPVEDLASWVEAPRLSTFVTRVIVPLHRRRLVEYDRESRTVVLSPTGATAAEALLDQLQSKSRK